MESGLLELPEGFGELQSLEKLWLSQNALRQLPSDFKCLRSLQALWLGDTLFKEVTSCPCNKFSACGCNLTILLSCQLS